MPPTVKDAHIYGFIDDEMFCRPAVPLALGQLCERTACLKERQTIKAGLNYRFNLW